MSPSSLVLHILQGHLEKAVLQSDMSHSQNTVRKESYLITQGTNLRTYRDLMINHLRTYDLKLNQKITGIKWKHTPMI